MQHAVRGRFYRPIKQAISHVIVIPSEAELPLLRQFCAVEGPFVCHGRGEETGYQTRANQILRQQMLADLRRA